jgi:hypothetical protein
MRERDRGDRGDRGGGEREGEERREERREIVSPTVFVERDRRRIKMSLSFE